MRHLIQPADDHPVRKELNADATVVRDQPFRTDWLAAMEDAIFNSPAESPYVQPSEISAGSGPLVTPGLIVASLTPSRLAEVRKHAETVPPAHTCGANSPAVRMLAALQVDELRKIARTVSVPHEGEFIDLFRRLAVVCRAT